MKYDPTTPEGKKILLNKIKQGEKFANTYIKLAKSGNPDDEPTGKLTNPDDLTVQRIVRGKYND